MSKRITTITVSMLALLLMLAVPSYAQKPGKVAKAKRTTAFELANNRAELIKKYPALAHAQRSLKQNETVLKSTITGQLQKMDRKAFKAGDGTVLTGNLTYDGQEAFETGLYSFPSSDNPQLSEVAVDKAFGYNNCGGAVVDGVYYFTEYVSFLGYVFIYTYAYNMEEETWIVKEESAEDYDIIAIGSNTAYDEATGKTYGVFYNADLTGIEFGTIDYANWTRTGVLPSPAHMEEYVTMACDGKGNLYACTVAGEIYKIDTTTGAETLVVATGRAIAGYLQAAAVNAANNTLYWNYLLDDGDYPTCGLAEINLTTGESNFMVWPDIYEFTMLYIPVISVEPGAPAGVDNLKAYLETSDPNNVFVSFMLPTKTFDGQGDLTGMLEYSIYVNGEEALKGSGQPGAQVIHKIEDVETGNTTIMVIVRNTVGDGDKVKTKLWVGADSPASPAPATLAIAGDEATVTWTAPNMEGVHGGYVNTSEVTYTVTRYPDEVVVADGIKETTYTETIDISALKVYYYGIVANYGPAESEEALTNFEKVGDAIIPPYVELFENADIAAKLYTSIDANADGSSWTLRNGGARYTYNGKNDADDWLISPNIKLEAGKLYLVHITAGAYLSSYPERLEVMMGQGSDPNAYGITILEPTDLTTEMNDFEVPVTVDADGVYNIGFHAISDADMFYLELMAWGISEPIDFGAPNVSTDLAVVPGAKGALNATINFTAPTKTVGGDALEEITKIVVEDEVGDDPIAVIENPAPGAALSAEVTVPSSDVYSYTITAYNSKGVGLPATVKGFIGVDLPGGVNNIKGYDNFDGSATFTWDAHGDKGINGGYVDPESVTYRLYSVTSDGYLGDIITETQDTQYVLASEALDNGPANLVQIAISAFVGEDEGPIYAGAVVGGTPSALPYYESFPGPSIVNYWWISTINGNTWNLYGDAVDGDGGCAGFIAQTAGAAGTLNTAKISVKGAANPKLLFSWIALPGDDLKVSVLGDRQDGKDPVVLKEIDVKNLTGDIEWHDEVIDLSAFTADPYFILSFLAEANEAGVAFEFDDVRIYDVYAHDLDIALNTPKSVAPGDEITAVAIISNTAENAVAAGDYSVVFTVNGKEFANVTETPALDAYKGVDVVSAKYVPGVIDGTPLAIKAEVVFSRDLDPENNVAEKNVNLKIPSVARVNDLTAETGGWPAVELKWSAPVQQASEGVVVTEDFEDQEIFVPLSVGGITDAIHTGMFGQWKLYDGNNGATTYCLSNGPSYENVNAPMAFQVMNPTVAGFDLTNPDYASMLNPNSGEQYLMAWNIETLNDKWLISPLLCGDAQTISFFVKEIVDTYGPELYEVLYSTTDDDIASFEKLADAQANNVDWMEVSYDLPAGAKYFAIRLVSTDVFALQIDDITYTSATSKKFALADESGVTGYNIYRDGKVIATVDANTTSYIDVNETDGEHTYYVTALYGEIESGLSNGATVVTAISEITSDASLMDADITVYSTAGAVIASGKGVYGNLAKGVYVIKNNETGAVKGVSKK